MRALFTALLLTVCPLTFAYESLTLSNGLRVVLEVDKRSPLVLTQMWYGVGSFAEQNGHTGLSHILEHSLFFGTQQISPHAMKRYISQRGGQENAFTSRDFTAYYTYLPKRYLRDALFLEQQRMAHAIIPHDLFQNEMKVIRQERYQRIDANPIAQAQEWFHALAFIKTPYHHPVIGWESDLFHVTREDVLAWYHTWYAPNHATLLVLGDIDIAQTKQMIHRLFDPIPRGKKIEPPHTPALKPMGTRRLQTHITRQTGYAMFGFTVPSRLSQPDETAYQLRVLAAVMSEGHSAQLDQALKYQQHLVSSISVSYPMYQRFPTTLTIHCLPAPGVSIQQLEKALQHEIKTLQTKPVSAKDLARAKAQILAAHTYAHDDIMDRASQYGQRLSVGLTLKEYQAFEKHINQVTAKAVQHMAQTYLIPARLIVVTQPASHGDTAS